MCADQLWNLRVFWLGIPVVVLHELFVKLVQNLPKKMGDINFFSIGKSKNLWKSVKKARMKCAKRFLERPMEQKFSALKKPKRSKKSTKCRHNGPKKSPNWDDFAAKVPLLTKEATMSQKLSQYSHKSLKNNQFSPKNNFWHFNEEKIL